MKNTDYPLLLYLSSLSFPSSLISSQPSLLPPPSLPLSPGLSPLSIPSLSSPLSPSSSPFCLLFVSPFLPLLQPQPSALGRPFRTPLHPSLLSSHPLCSALAPLPLSPSLSLPTLSSLSGLPEPLSSWAAAVQFCGLALSSLRTGELCHPWATNSQQLQPPPPPLQSAPAMWNTFLQHRKRRKNK